MRDGTRKRFTIEKLRFCRHAGESDHVTGKRKGAAPVTVHWHVSFVIKNCSNCG